MTSGVSVSEPIGYHFKVGDRVTRDFKTEKPEWSDLDPSIIKHGTVARAYSANHRCLGFYPELYEVAWDDSTRGEGYLPHGIQGTKP